MQTTRRSFVSRCLAPALCSAGFLEKAVLRAAQARAEARPSASTLFDIAPAARNVWLALARPAAMLNSNAAIFELADGLLIVDSHSKPSAAAALVAQIRRELTSKPVRYLVNTHFHYDHAHGNNAYRALTPKVEIVASATTRQALEQRGGQAIRESVESMRRNLESAREQLGKARSGESRRYYQGAAAEMEAYIQEMRDVTPELPDITFEENLVLHDRLQPLHLVFRGRAHTASDICVLSPSRKAVATGDLVVGFIPGMGDGFPLEWPATLRSLADLPFSAVLPGHGGLQESRQRLVEMRTYIEEVNEAVVAGKRQGRSMEQLTEAITPAALRTLNGTGYGNYVAEMTRRYRLLAPNSDPWASIRSGVKGNVEAVYRKTPAA
jgi:glyoxylase-like metal-dependent hydrolase (beta-lactamase superfamily II)